MRGATEVTTLCPGLGGKAATFSTEARNQMLVRVFVGERAGAGRSRQGHALALGWRHKLWNHPDLGSNPSSDTGHAWPGSSYILALHCGLLICKTKGAGRPTPQGYHEVDTTVMMGSAWPRQTQRSSKMSPCLDNRPPATAATALPTPSSPGVSVPWLAWPLIPPQMTLSFALGSMALSGVKGHASGKTWGGSSEGSCRAAAPPSFLCPLYSPPPLLT